MRGWLVALTLAASGCSLAFTSRPKPAPRPPECTTSLQWPIVDSVATGAGVIGLAVTGAQYAMAEDNHTQDPQDRADRLDRLKLQAAGFLVWTIAWAVSSNIGAFRVLACRDAAQ